MARILMAGSEATPFAKAGGLADVLASLPRALAQAGHDVAVALPLYRGVRLPSPKVVFERLLVRSGRHSFTASVIEQKHNDVRYLFVNIPELYDRNGIYGDDGAGDYPDNHLRFAVFSHAVLAIMRHVFCPQILHCHDWPSALLPFLLKEIYVGHPAYLGVRTIFTIHNLGYQGQFDSSIINDLGLPSRSAEAGALEFQGRISFLKAGIVSATRITTVSPHYVSEIQTEAYGFGLHEVLRSRTADLSGILNGVDYELWNPARDRELPHRFDIDFMEGKHACKRNLLEELHLSPNRIQRPLLAIISRFAEQKGFDLLLSIPYQLAALNVSIAVLGSGDTATENFFRWLAGRYPDRVSFTYGYNNGLTHRMNGGADIVLMPSRYEPCGLAQMYGMRYGALPVVRATGGLSDTVDGQTGFLFSESTPQAIMSGLQAATQVYGTPRWTSMVRQAMKKRFSVEKAAAGYAALYQSLL